MVSQLRLVSLGDCLIFLFRDGPVAVLLYEIETIGAFGLALAASEQLLNKGGDVQIKLNRGLMDKLLKLFLGR